MKTLTGSLLLAAAVLGVTARAAAEEKPAGKKVDTRVSELRIYTAAPGQTDAPQARLEPLPPRASRSDVLRLLTEQGGIDRRLVGRIDVQGRLAVVEVPDGWHTRLARALDGADLNGRRLRAWCDADVSAEGDHFSRL